MPTERLTMRKTREILRHKWILKRSHRETSKAVGVSVGAVSAVLERAAEANLNWNQAEGLGDDELERLLFPTMPAAVQRPEPDCEWVHRERHRPGVTLELLHLEYLEQHPNGFRYTAFCDRYRDWLDRRGLVMRQIHAAGDKLFVDYSGKRAVLVSPTTGEVSDVELFVAVLGASNLTYAEVTQTQRARDWIGSHIRALEFFGGVPAAIVPDQLKSGVSRSCRYEPEAQRTYEEFARHYGTSILPARPGRPRDKAKVEVGVQIAQRWLLGRMRNEVYHSLAAMNARIAELLVDLNARVMRRYGKSRRELFDLIEKTALRPLPPDRFEYSEWARARVNIDYHVLVDGHLYSVPYRLAHEEVEARLTAQLIEIFLRGQRVAAHPRSLVRGAFTTNAEHMPSAHRAHAKWTPSRILAWAHNVGSATHDLCHAILRDRPHPEQGFRSCLGILRLATQYGEARLEVACSRALVAQARSYRHVSAILKRGLDGMAQSEQVAEGEPIEHENLRGRDYYH